MYISNFMENMIKLGCHKQVIFIGASFGGLITLRGVLVISSCFYFTLRIMFNSSFFFFFFFFFFLGGGGGGGGREFKNSIFFQKSNFCISLPVLVISFKLFGCYLHVFFFFFLYHMSWVGA